MAQYSLMYKSSHGTQAALTLSFFKKNTQACLRSLVRRLFQLPENCEFEHVLMTDKQAAAHANQAVAPELNPCICLTEFTSAQLAVPITASLLCAYVCACV